MDPLHHQRGLLDAVDLRDVGVVQRSEDASLPEDPRDPLGISRERSGEDLHRHLAAEHGVAAAVDLAHSADAQHRRDLERAEARRDRERLPLEETIGGGLEGQQALDRLPQRFVAAALDVEEIRARVQWTIEGGLTDPLDVRLAITHRSPRRPRDPAGATASRTASRASRCRRRRALPSRSPRRSGR